MAKKHNIPFVYYFIDVLHKLNPEKTFQSLGKWFTQKTIENEDLIITINKKLSEFAIKMGSKPETIKLIDVGIDLNNYNPDLVDSKIREEYGIAKDDVVLFFMGWIYEFSGMNELARALCDSKYKYPNYKILVVGDGDAYYEMCQVRDDYNMMIN